MSVMLVCPVYNENFGPFRCRIFKLNAKYYFDKTAVCCFDDAK
jgi:hypothetical protein